jgi:hypothetical protein
MLVWNLSLPLEDIVPSAAYYSRSTAISTAALLNVRV